MIKVNHSRFGFVCFAVILCLATLLGATVSVAAAGEPLEQTVSAWNADTDADGKGDNFFFVGASIREETADTTRALRFITQLNTKSVPDTFSVVEYGTVVLPKEILGDAELVLGGSYTYGGNTYDAAAVKGEKIWQRGNGYVQYNVALINIKNTATEYAVRAYAICENADGERCTTYFGEEKTASIDSVREAAREEAEKAVILPEEGYAPDKRICLGAVSLKNGVVTMEICNVSAIWETEDGKSYFEYTCYDIDGDVLAVDRINFGYIPTKSQKTVTFTIPESTARVELTDFNAEYWSVPI
jgi:hypothetical protein